MDRSTIHSNVSCEATIVLDYGSACLKAGMAMEESPDLLLPTYHTESLPNIHSIMLDCSPAECLAAQNSDESTAKSTRSVLRGEVINWDLYESILSKSLLHIGYTEGFDVPPILIAEHPLTSKAQREKIAEIIFEKIRCPALSFASSAVLSTIASGRTSGLAVECGSGVSYVTPVFEGYGLDHATQRLEIAGQDITENCWKMLHPYADPRCDLLTAQRFKESCVTATMQSPFLPSRDSSVNGDSITFSLPDEQTITFAVQTSGPIFGRSFQIRPQSSLSRPSAHTTIGLHDCVAASILACDASIHSHLVNNIILSGGTTMMPGFGDCLKSEVTHELSKIAVDKSASNVPLASPANRRRTSSVRTNVSMEAEAAKNAVDERLLNHVRLIPYGSRGERGYNTQRRYGAWIGGSIVASLDTFSGIRVSRNNWEDIGRESVSRKKI